MNLLTLLAHFPPVLLYLGPETILPLGSAIAAVVGFILLTWRFLLGLARKAFYKISGRPVPEPVDATVEDSGSPSQG